MDLNQVTLPCTSYDESVAFYELLGFTIIVDSPPRYARFETATGTTFSIHHTVTNTRSPDVIIYFEVDDVDATVEQLKQKGITFTSEPETQRWLWREARLVDPAGNHLCIYHAGENRRYPPWRVDPSG